MRRASLVSAADIATSQQMSALLEAGLDLSPIITKRPHYTQFEEGFERLARGLPGKVIMDWHDKIPDHK